MTTLQFTLFFLAIVVAYVLVHLRISRLETLLRDLQHLARIDDRLGSVVASLDRVRMDGVEALLRDVRKDLSAQLDAIYHLEKTQTRPLVEPSTETDGTPRLGAGSDAERIRTLVEERLLGLGHRKLRILTDLRGASLDEETIVHVESERDGMPSKGKIHTKNGAVLDVQIQSGAPMFP
jgi:hypothetical protein